MPDLCLARGFAPSIKVVQEPSYGIFDIYLSDPFSDL